MSIELELETEVETEVGSETTKKNSVEPSLRENRTRLLLMKRDNSDQGPKNIERMMAQFDPNGS